MSVRRKRLFTLLPSQGPRSRPAHPASQCALLPFLPRPLASRSSLAGAGTLTLTGRQARESWRASGRTPRERRLRPLTRRSLPSAPDLVPRIQRASEMGAPVPRAAFRTAHQTPLARATLPTRSSQLACSPPRVTPGARARARTPAQPAPPLRRAPALAQPRSSREQARRRETKKMAERGGLGGRVRSAAALGLREISRDDSIQSGSQLLHFGSPFPLPRPRTGEGRGLELAPPWWAGPGGTKGGGPPDHIPNHNAYFSLI